MFCHFFPSTRNLCARFDCHNLYYCHSNSSPEAVTQRHVNKPINRRYVMDKINFQGATGRLGAWRVSSDYACFFFPVPHKNKTRLRWLKEMNQFCVITKVMLGKWCSDAPVLPPKPDLCADVAIDGTNRIKMPTLIS